MTQLTRSQTRTYSWIERADDAKEPGAGDDSLSEMTNSTVYTDKNPRIVPMRFTQETQPYVWRTWSLFEYLFHHFQNKSIVSTPFWHQHICHHSRDCLELSSHTNIEDKANHTFNCSNSRAHPRHCSTGDISPMIPKQKIEVPHLRVCFPPIERQLWSRIQKKTSSKTTKKETQTQSSFNRHSINSYQ